MKTRSQTKSQINISGNPPNITVNFRTFEANFKTEALFYYLQYIQNTEKNVKRSLSGILSKMPHCEKDTDAENVVKFNMMLGLRGADSKPQNLKWYLRCYHIFRDVLPECNDVHMVFAYTIALCTPGFSDQLCCSDFCFLNPRVFVGLMLRSRRRSISMSWYRKVCETMDCTLEDAVLFVRKFATTDYTGCWKMSRDDITFFEQWYIPDGTKLVSMETAKGKSLDFIIVLSYYMTKPHAFQGPERIAQRLFEKLTCVRLRFYDVVVKTKYGFLLPKSIIQLIARFALGIVLEEGDRELCESKTFKLRRSRRLKRCYRGSPFQPRKRIKFF